MLLATGVESSILAFTAAAGRALSCVAATLVLWLRPQPNKHSKSVAVALRMDHSSLILIVEAQRNSRAMASPELLYKIFRHFRSHRMRLFERTFQISRRTRVLDVGGSPLIWQFASVQPRLTILNFPSALVPHSHAFDQVAGDGRFLPFGDSSFDVVFSNSVIEHVGARSEQRRFAEEVARVGKQFWIQTPNRGFPVELHMMLPFVHYLPKTWQHRIVTRFTGWQFVVHPPPEERAGYVHHFLHELNLLTAQDLRALFPQATVISERIAGIPKSLVAVRS